ncbi:MAG: type II secretion system minor pseudopilin GspK [Gammaproteobacteria bacterium]
MRNSYRRQKGVALITAILMVSLATIAAVSMANRQQIDIRRTGNFLHHEQARSFVEAAESWAQVILIRDAANSTIDTLEEDWATTAPVSSVEGGSISGKLVDLQGRFNLNNLYDSSNNAEHILSVDYFRRLLINLNLNQDLVDALIDWIDENIEPKFPGGAEDSEYLSRDPTYRASNQYLVNITELLLIKGFDHNIVEKLQPFVCVLPEFSPINVNTAPAEVLQALGAALSVADAEALINARGQTGYADTAGFLSQPNATGINADMVTVDSFWFRLLGVAAVGQARAEMTSKIQRTASSDIRVVSREWVLREPMN